MKRNVATCFISLIVRIITKALGLDICPSFIFRSEQQSVINVLFPACSHPANGTAKAGGEGSFCVPNGNEAIKFLGFKEVSENESA